MKRCLLFVPLAALLSSSLTFGAEPLRVGTFEVDATPPVGSPLAYEPDDGRTDATDLPGNRPGRRGPTDRLVLFGLDRNQ